MVREVQMSWDDESPMPEELSRNDWDCDDPAPGEPEREVRKRSKRGLGPIENPKQKNRDR